MWYLISAENPDLKFVLLVGKEYIVGRKDCDVVIPSDQTVSRKHASIKVTHTEANVSHPHKLPLITLRDLSKYGTSVNKSRLKGEVLLKDGDEVVFGSIKSTYLVVYEPFVITTSCMENAAKKQLKASVCKLGGHIVSEWRKDCSMLVMNSISVTIKVICALVSLKPIVSPDYIEAFVKSLEPESDVNPNPDDYLPNVVETQISQDDVSFKSDERRKTLFQGMKFIFLNPKQFKKMSIAVELGGGMPMLMEEGSDQGERVLIEKGSVVMTCASDDTSLTQNGRDWVEHVRQYLKKHKKNMILEAELGYAVLYCSTETHCNPCIDSASELLMKVPSQTLSQQPAYTDSEILAADTEKSDIRKERSFIKTDISVVDQTTLEDPQTSTGKSSPIPIVGENEPTTESTRKKTDVENSKTRQSSKRTRDDDASDREEVFAKKIKQEKLTPPNDRARSRQRQDEPIQASIIPSKTFQMKEKDNLTKMSKVKQEDSSDDDMFSSNKESLTKKKSPVRSPKNSSRSPSPSTRSSARIAQRVGSASPSRISEHKSEDKSHSPERSSRRNLGNSDSPSPSRSPNQTAEKVLVFKQKATKMTEIIEDDDFDEIISSCDVKIENTSNVEDKVQGSPLSRIKDSRSRSPGRPFGEKSAKPSTHSRSPTLERSLETRNKKSKRQHSTSPCRRGAKREIHSDEDFDGKEVKPFSSRRYADVEVTEGFLSARIQNQRGDTIKSEEYANELPSNLVLTEFTSLVCRQPKKLSASASDGVPEGYMRWKGKLVKNFKKFKKTQHIGANNLPRIIGGSDLQEHTNTQNRIFDDFSQVDSQTTESDRVAQDLFDWESNSSRGRRAR